MLDAIYVCVVLFVIVPLILVIIDGGVGSLL